MKVNIRFLIWKSLKKNEQQNKYDSKTNCIDLYDAIDLDEV